MSAALEQQQLENLRARLAGLGYGVMANRGRDGRVQWMVFKLDGCHSCESVRGIELVYARLRDAKYPQPPGP